MASSDAGATAADAQATSSGAITNGTPAPLSGDVAVEVVGACLGSKTCRKRRVGHIHSLFSGMTPVCRSHTLRSLETQIDDHVAEGPDAAQMLRGPVWRFSQRCPEVADTFLDGSGPAC